ncbi:glutamic acid-rich protein-like isoform X1 [Trichogramma pretiosum]|uniref:glutamic acid-rich protein-like isoform X1 n=2 Tax=Trichogramma pretiosum TaxID=7493 RepID=UPI0006C996A2|nr:glutamic acid-rich protein-like isoform X1 [Trichogramma pretiosum]
MKYHQQVSVDLVNMVYTAIAYLAVAGAAWLFLRFVQACFCLPGHLRRQNNVQQMLQEKVDSYERYIRDCEAKEAAGLATTSSGNSNDTRSLEEQQKERKECLDMLKRELKRIQEGGDPYDFAYLLDEEEKRLLEDSDKEEDDNKSNENKIKIDEDQDQPDADDDLAKSDDDESEPKKDK